VALGFQDRSGYFSGFSLTCPFERLSDQSEQSTNQNKKSCQKKQYERGMQQGMQWGMQQGRHELLIKMLENGLDPVQVADLTGVGLAEIQGVAEC
jgi:hypothetical protein